MQDRARVMYMATSKKVPFDELSPFYLKDSEFQLWSHFADSDFDNADSRYVKIKMHMYSNTFNSDDGEVQYSEREIDMVQCTNENVLNRRSKEKFFPGRFWCPQFTDEDYLQADYNQERNSWMRLVVHYCNLTERSREGKDCASNHEI